MSAPKEPTRQDSLFLLNNNVIIDKYLKSNKYKLEDYKKINSKNWNDQFNGLKEYLDVMIKQDIEFNEKKHPASAYKKIIGDFVGTSDWTSGGGDDYGVPFQYIHPKIAPQYSGDLVAKTSEGYHTDKYPSIFSYGYENLAITPWDMLDKKQQELRLKKYGKTGTPFDIKTESNIPLMLKRKNYSYEESVPLKTKVNQLGPPLSLKSFIDYGGSYIDQPQVAPKTDGTVYTDNELAKMGYRSGTPNQIKSKGTINKYGNGGPVNNNTSWFNQDLVRQANERMVAPSTTTLGKVIPKTGAYDTRVKYITKNPGSYNIEDYKQGHQEPGAEPIPLEAMLLPGTPVIKGLGKLGNFALDAINPFQGMRNINKVAPHLSPNAKSALSHDAASPIIYNAATAAMGGISPVMYEAIMGDGNADPEELLKNMGIGAGLGYLAGNAFRNKAVKSYYKKFGEYYDNYDTSRKKWAIRSQKLKDELSSLKTLQKAREQAAKEGVINQPDIWGFKKAERQAIFDMQTAKDIGKAENFQHWDSYGVNPHIKGTNVNTLQNLYDETTGPLEGIENIRAPKHVIDPNSFWVDYSNKDHVPGTMHNIDNASSDELTKAHNFVIKMHENKYSKFTPQMNKYGGVVKMAKGGIIPKSGYISVGQYPSFKNADGTYSNEVSVGMNIEGKETLVPSFWNGSVHTNDEAYERYKQTGEHLGQFNNLKDAERGAQLREFMNNNIPRLKKGGIIPKMKFGSIVNDWALNMADPITSIVNKDIIPDSAYKTEVGRDISNVTGGLTNAAAPAAAGLFFGPAGAMGMQAIQMGSNNFVKPNNDPSDTGKIMNSFDPFLRMGASAGAGAIQSNQTSSTPSKKEGGPVDDKTMINVEGGELEIDPSGKILKEFRNKPKHPAYGIDEEGNTMSTPGNIIIPKTTVFGINTKKYKERMYDPMFVNTAKHNLKYNQKLNEGKFAIGGPVGPRADEGFFNFDNNRDDTKWNIDTPMTPRSSPQLPSNISPLQLFDPMRGSYTGNQPLPSQGSDWDNSLNKTEGVGNYQNATPNPQSNQGLQGKDIAGAAATYGPVLYNLGRSLFDKPVKFNSSNYTTNPNLKFDPLTGNSGRNDMKGAYASARAGVRNLSGTGAQLQALTGLTNKYFEQLGKFNENLENTNKMGIFEASKANKSIESQNGQTRFQTDMFNEQSRANKRNFGSTAVGQASQAYQAERNNKMLYEYLNKYNKTDNTPMGEPIFAGGYNTNATAQNTSNPTYAPSANGLEFNTMWKNYFKRQ